MFHFRGGRYELAVLNSLGGDQLTRDFVHFIGSTSNDDHLQTVVFVQMNVQTGVDYNLCFVLHICQEVAQAMNPVVINQRHDADDFAISLTDFLLNQVVTNQVANSFRARLIALTPDASIERFKQIIF